MPTQNELHTFGVFKKRILEGQANYKLPNRNPDGSFEAPALFTSGYCISGEELKAAEWMAMLEFRALQFAIKHYTGKGMTRPDPTLTSEERDVWFVKERNAILANDDMDLLLQRYRNRNPNAEQFFMGVKVGSLLNLWGSVDTDKEKVARVERGGYGIVIQNGLYEETRHKGYGAEVLDDIRTTRRIDPKQLGLEY